MDREMAVMRLVHEMRGEASAVRRELGEVVAAIERIRALMVRVLVYSAIAAIAAPKRRWCPAWALPAAIARGWKVTQ